MIATERESRDRALFDRIAKSYCTKDLSRVSRPAREQRLRQSMRHLPDHEGISLLEVGCGAGFSARYLAGLFRQYVGIDYSPELIAFARAHNDAPGVDFEVANINDFQTLRRFDVALMIGVLHHLDDLDHSLRSIHELLAPGGWIVANEPHPTNPAIHLARSIRKRIDPKYSSDQRELSGSELRDSLDRAGFAEIRLIPQGLLSTPFAEVPLKPDFVWSPVSRICCSIDRILEKTPAPLLRPLSWNLVVMARKPTTTGPAGQASESPT